MRRQRELAPNELNERAVAFAPQCGQACASTGGLLQNGVQMLILEQAGDLGQERFSVHSVSIRKEPRSHGCRLWRGRTTVARVARVPWRVA